MRATAWALLVLAATSGCTNLRLQRSLLNQAGTLTELQYQQVLGNLAMLSRDPYALPAHANLRDGSAQIQDFGSAVAGAELTFTSKALPSLTGSRTVVEQWGVVPVTDDLELKIMQIAYRRALGCADRSTIDADLANDVAHELCRQISQSDDIDLRSDPTINNAAIRSQMGLIEQSLVIDSAAPEAGRSRPAPLPPPAEPLPTSPGSDHLTRDKKLDYYERNFRRNEPFALELSQLADSLSYLRLESNDEEIIHKDEWNKDFDISAWFNRPPWAEGWLPFTATPVVREARRQTLSLAKDVQQIHPGWFGVGGKHDVPRDACYVGRYRDRYAWVCPAGTKDLADFTLKMLSFSSLIKDQSILTIPGGPRFTPSNGGR